MSERETIATSSKLAQTVSELHRDENHANWIRTVRSETLAVDGDPLSAAIVPLDVSSQGVLLPAPAQPQPTIPRMEASLWTMFGGGVIVMLGIVIWSIRRHRDPDLHIECDFPIFLPIAARDAT